MTAPHVRSTAVFVVVWTLLAGAAALVPRLTGNGFDIALGGLTIAGQWFLLRDRAWWATRWALCVVVGAVLPAVAAILLRLLVPQSTLPRSPVYGVGLQVATALPAALVLVPVAGARALALLLPAIAALLMRHYAIAGGASPFSSSSPPLHWPPLQFALPVAARGLIEAGVLAWLVAASPRRADGSPAAQSAATAVRAASPASAASPGSRSSAAHGWLAAVWLLTAMVVLLMLPALTGSSRPHAPSPEQTALIALIVAPYAAAVAATFVPIARAFGLSALAVGAGGVALLGGVFVASRGGWFLMGGPAGLLLLWMPALHGALAASAVRAMWLSTAPALRASALVSGGALIVLYAVAAHAGFFALTTREAGRRAAEASAKPEARAGRAFDAVERCLYRAARAVPSPRWPRTVDDLGPGRLRCLTAEELRPADDAYAIHVTAPMNEAPPAAFFVCVTRVLGGRVWARTLSERQSIFGNDGSGDTAAAACANAAGDVLGRARYCVWDWAATHSDGYPMTLDALVAPGACLAPTGSGVSRDVRTTYVPGNRSADGRMTSFVLLHGPATDGTRPFPRYRLDETGAIRSTRQPRLPTSRDPLDRLWEPRPADGRRRGDPSGDFDWARSCAAGRTEDCVVLGGVLEARASRWSKIMMRTAGDSASAPLAALDGRPLADGDLERALDVYRSACRASSAEGCARAAALLMIGTAAQGRLAEVWTLRARACDLGDGPSCDAQAMDDAPGRPQGMRGDLRVSAAACAGGDRTACSTAGTLASAQGAPHEGVVGLFLRGCDLGDAEACFEASQIVAGPNPAHAAALRAIACSMAPAPTACSARDR